jgi:phosphate transport system ATP-binding protein
MSPSRPYISVRNLNVSYGDQQALKDITVDIPEKQITAIIGPSGCGKTTLLKCFNRLIDLTEGLRLSGQVFVDGVNIYSDKAMDVTCIRKKMGLLSQKPFPLPMSIYDNVAYGLRLHGLNDKRKLNEVVEHHLQTVGLWEEVKDRLRSPASKLSSGQQQRLCLARGLAVEPEAILGDEPTSALDPVSAQRIEKAFLELKRHYSIVIVTHILRQARRLADYVLFLYLGELVEHGPAEQVFQDPREPRTQAYIKGEIS